MTAYEILGISSSATVEEAKKAYRMLCRKHHPDAGGSQEKFEEISKAFKQFESGQANRYVRPTRQSLKHKSIFSFT